MELGLSLGDTVPKPLQFLHDNKPQKIIEKDLGFCMAVGKMNSDDENNGRSKETGLLDRASSSDPPVQLDLLPFDPVHKTTQNLFTEPGRGLVVNRSRVVEEELKTEISSPEYSRFSSSFNKIDFSVFRGKRDFEGITTYNINISNSDDHKGSASSRGSDDHEEENGISRKKLRLSKEQSAFLEESFKEHNTLNPKQKLGLAKQLNLRPRQVEVWFQNRRARTKLKQTEVDCEYLKRWSTTLTEENRRLQRELQELRALKASKPFSPATTLTMCPSCEKVSTTAAAAATAAATKPKQAAS
ncbi:hypothetical protein BUALT_Bualt16G0126400 [Buddleja alternifolia]|uniref:Homeobox domain-containing protein n=1 Tax=Buddleja alternifolia TaxID=168488 RepID=A0AAV6WGK9_9LAMI|nr:hypothetical protein BUALT_Bualt16G0126400 [Buddleja alternifolia]